MNRLQVLILGMFALTLGTGVLLGMGLGRRPAEAPKPWLVSELQLTPSQEDAMRKIWQDVTRGIGTNMVEERRRLASERDEKIVSLIPEDQKQTYNLVVQQYAQQVAKLNRDREAAFERAVDETKKILDPGQQAQYEALMKQGFRGQPWARPPTTRAASRAATQPSSQPVQP